jgi:hypothetical protein
MVSRVMRWFVSVYFPMSKEEPVEFICHWNIVVLNGISGNFRCHCLVSQVILEEGEAKVTEIKENEEVRERRRNAED